MSMRSIPTRDRRKETVCGDRHHRKPPPGFQAVRRTGPSHAACRGGRTRGVNTWNPSGLSHEGHIVGIVRTLTGRAPTAHMARVGPEPTRSSCRGRSGVRYVQKALKKC